MTKKIQQLPMITPDVIEKNLSDLNLLFIRRYGNYVKSPWEAWPAMLGFINDNYLDRTTMRFFGICHDAMQLTTGDKVEYDAAIYSPEKVKEKNEVGRQVLKGGKYAIFTHKGPFQGLEETFNRIFLKWLPDSCENLDESRLVFCEYFNLEFIKTDPEKLVTKLFIPLLPDEISKNSAKIEGLVWEHLR
jgi:AraC family transcriptional regulator